MNFSDLRKKFTVWFNASRDAFRIKVQPHLKTAYREILVGFSGKETPDTPCPPIKVATRFGLIVLFVFFGIFVTWSLFAPLESAAVANGKVVVASNKKTIQHLEGGIIREIFVKDGSVVKAGEPLIELEDTQAKANYELLSNQANDLSATVARLMAERDLAPSITYPERLQKHKNDTDVAKLIKAQESIFENNKKTYEGQMIILQQRVAQLDKQIVSLNAQVDSSDKQLEFIGKELDSVRTLDKKHLIEKPRLWALERESARLSGNRGDTLGQIAQAQQKIGETQQQIITVRDSIQKDTMDKLSDAQSKLSDVLQREKAAEDVLDRITITAPQDGTVVGLQEHTVGGVIMAGKPIMDIVPSNDEMIIEARMSPLDIEAVHPGLPAKIQLIAYKRRNTPWINGTVREVSADSFLDTQTNTTYYTAQISISHKEIVALKHIILYPGMPVSVMVITDKRTPFAYFFSPLKDSFNRAFREA